MNNRKSLIYGITIGRSASSFLRGQLKWFRDRGYDVTLITSPDEAAQNTMVREEVSLAPIQMERDISFKADLVALMSWCRELRSHRPTVVNVSTPKAGLLGGIASWLLRVPKRVYVVRGLRLEGANGLKRVVLWCVEWVTQRVATDVVFVSKSLASESLRLRITPRNRAWTIGSGSSNGVFADAVADRAALVDSSSLRRSLSIPRDAFVIGFIGRLNTDKGVDTLIRVLDEGKLLSHVHLLIIGPVEDPEIMRQLRSRTAGVSIVGWTDDVWGHLAVIDTLILPTRREGFPNVVLEAAAVGIPAITTNATGAVDSVVDGVTGYIIDTDDSGALARKINQIARDRVLRESLGNAAKERAAKDFVPENIWQGLADIIEGNPNSDYAKRIYQAKEKN